MPRPRRALSFFVRTDSILALAVLALTAAVPAYGAPQHAATVQTEQTNTAQTVTQSQVQDLPGAGRDWTELISMTPGVGVTERKDFDANKALREDDLFFYTPAPDGTSKLTGEQRDYLNPNKVIEYKINTDWNLNGGLNDYRFRSFGPRGEKISDYKTEYKLNLRTDYEWDPYGGSLLHTTPYTPAPAPPPPPVQKGKKGKGETSMATPPATTTEPQTETVGFLFPRDFQAGETITGSLWKSSYAEAFKSVPGLAEYTFPIQTYNLPDGTPSWTGLEMGVKGYGYTPVRSNGEFSIHIPMDWKGPLLLHGRELDLPGSNVATYDNLLVGDPVAAPTLSQNLAPVKFGEYTQAQKISDLIDLWNEAYDYELEYADAEADGASEAVLEDIDDDLWETYGDIDHVTSLLPNDVVVQLAHDLADETREINTAIRKNDLTDDQKSELSEYDGWANFLDGEAEESGTIRIESIYNNEFLYGTSPVLSQGRLGVLRGPFSGNDCNHEVRLDNQWLHPIGETPNNFYFMPPDGLTSGLHNFQIGGYGMPQTTLPVFYLTLTMWADAYNLQKGQATTYHLKLTGLNGLPGSAWSSSYYASDLFAPSDLQGSAPSSLTGTITLTITNGSPGVISMQNVYTVLNAQSFAPSGTFQVDGGVGAILDGGFSILGVARAFLNPVAGFGSYTYPQISQDSSAPTSTASAPGWPTCTVPDPPPVILLPLNNLYGKSCMGPDTTDLYNHATVGNPPSDEGGPPPRPSREAAEQRVTAAEQAVKDWKDRVDKEGLKTSTTWKAGYDGIPQSFKDAVAKTANDDYHALMDEESARSLVRLNPTDENKAKLAAAEAKSAATHQAYNAAGDAARDQFTPEQRAAWENANNEYKSAEYYSAQAEEELRDARDALGRQFPIQPSLKYMF